jgi:type I restriction enzyme, S subunit
MTTITAKMKKESIVPTLRFNGFKEEWVKKSLGEIFSIFNGYAFSSDDSRDAGCRWVKIADVGINQINHDSTSYLPADYAQKYSKFLLAEGDYVVALTRPILGGKLKIAKVDSVLEGSLLNQRVGKLVSENDLTFVYTLLQRESLIARIENRIAGTDPPNLSPSEINSLRQSLPSLCEQQKIASFLSAVDEKIQQLTRKKELLELYKKGVMQQLFSGKLRFKDENGKPYPKWEDKKIGDVCDVRRGASPRPISDPKWFSNDSIIGWVRISDVTSSNKFLNKTEQYLSKEGISKSRLVKKGNMIMSICATIGKPIYTNFDVCIHDGFVVFDSLSLDKEYLYYYLDFIQEHWYGYGQPGTQVNLNSGIVSNESIPVPNETEQKKIASFLTALDSKIETAAKQIDETKTFKKGLLQQMFV